MGGERRRERELCSKRWNVDVLLCKECISIGTIESFKGLKQTPQTKENQTVLRFGQMPKSVIWSLKNTTNSCFFLKSCFLVPNSNLGKTYQGWHWICFLPTHGPSRLCVSASRFCLVAYRQSWFIIVQIDLNLRHWTLGNQDGDFGFFMGFNKLLFLKHMLKPIGSMYFFSLHLP